LELISGDVEGEKVQQIHIKLKETWKKTFLKKTDLNKLKE